MNEINQPMTDPNKGFKLLLDPHHIILYLILFASIGVGTYWYTSWKADKADLRAAVAEAKYETVKEANTVFQSQTQQQVQQLSTQNTQLQDEVKSLSVAIASRDKVLEKQQQVIVQLPPPQLAARWDELIGIPEAIKPAADNTYVTTGEGAVKTVQLLESVPVLEQDKKDLQTQVANQTDELVNSDKKYSLEKDAHEHDNQTNKTAIQTKQDEIDQAKADAKKGKAKWFIFGSIFGLIARGLLGI